MKLRLTILLASIPITLLLQGCGILGIHPKNTVKAEADFLETIPIGTSYETIIGNARAVELPFSGLASANSNKRLNYFICLFVTPNGRSLYRQWPKGILLNINDDDMYCWGGVCDNSGNDVAGVDIFFDSKHRFKGYYAFSNSLFSKDDKMRYEREKQQFHELGLDEVSALAKKWDKLAERGNDVENRLPTLPLSNWMQTNVPTYKLPAK